MNNAALSIRVDPDVKSKAQRLLAEYGLDISTAINMFLRQIIREEGVTFDLHPQRPNAAIQDAMDEAASGNVIGPFATAKEAIESMLEDD